jgi:hypothetical protein
MEGRLTRALAETLGIAESLLYASAQVIYPAAQGQYMVCT